MKNRSSRVVVVCVVATCLFASVGVTQRCEIGTGLASTLLFPYFEVDPGNPSGKATLLSITNEFSSPTLARVVFWTDYGIPTVSFDIYLKGFDVQTINVRSVFNGTIPSTGETEDLSGFPVCELLGWQPYHPNPKLNSSQQVQLVADHTGVVGPLKEGCAGANHSDGIARGYITVDVVDECAGFGLSARGTPAADNYFVNGSGSAGIGIESNRLWGDYFIVDPANNFAQGSEAVALWADPDRFTDDPTFTFYGRYSDYDGRDERVPLPSLWATRFLEGGAFDGGTELVIWRDTGVADVSRVPCDARPSWYPLPQAFVTARDETASEESRISLGVGEDLFPLATQAVSISEFDLPYPFGRIQFGLADGPGVSNPRQAWVSSTMSANDRFSVGFNARSINDLCESVP